MNPFYKNLALWMVIGLVAVLLFNVFQGVSEKSAFEPNYSDFLRDVDAGLVQSVTIRGNLVTGKKKDGTEFRTYVVTTRDGRVSTGTIIRETADAISLRTAQLAEVRIARAAVETMTPSPTSIMPEGLEKVLSRQELSDLLEFISSQK